MLGATQLSTLNDELIKNLFGHSLLCEDTNVFVRRGILSDLEALVPLYEGAFRRGDWFGSRSSSSVPGDAAREHLTQMLHGDPFIVSIFSDSDNNILGATALDLGDDEGVLIDDSQIDPIKGRRKGIMTKYFRRLVPAVNKFESFWTEFVLTPESGVLRRTLISELGMVVTGIRPNAYKSRATGEYRSVLVAHGPTDWVVTELRSLIGKGSLVADFLTALQPQLKNTTVNSIETLHRIPSDSFIEVKIPVSDIDGFNRQVSLGAIPTSFNVRSKSFSFCRWKDLDLTSLEFIKRENIDAATRLLAYLEGASAQTR